MPVIFQVMWVKIWEASPQVRRSWEWIPIWRRARSVSSSESLPERLGDHGFRRLGVIESAYLLDDLYVEIICDGKHLPPELIKLIYKIKGADRIALVTDSLALAGTDLTHGFMQNTEFVIEDGVCKLMDRSAFAGSIATTDRLVRVAVKEAGISLTDAVKMMTETPARIMGLEGKGRIAPQMDADFVVFDENVEIQHVFTHGELVKL